MHGPSALLTSGHHIIKLWLVITIKTRSQACLNHICIRAISSQCIFILYVLQKISSCDAGHLQTPWESHQGVEDLVARTASRLGLCLYMQQLTRKLARCCLYHPTLTVAMHLQAVFALKACLGNLPWTRCQQNCCLLLYTPLLTSHFPVLILAVLSHACLLTSWPSELRLTRLVHLPVVG